MLNKAPKASRERGKAKDERRDGTFAETLPQGEQLLAAHAFIDFAQEGFVWVRRGFGQGQQAFVCATQAAIRLRG